MWEAQVSSALKGAQMAGFIKPSATAPDQFMPPKEGAKKEDPPIENPKFEKWMAKDQQVLSYLLHSISPEIAAQITSAKTATAAWAVIQGLNASQSRARIISTRMALATASKGTSTISEYFVKMKSLADEMASVGHKLEDEELVSYILTGLDLEFNPVVSAVAARVEPITIPEL